MATRFLLDTDHFSFIAQRLTRVVTRLSAIDSADEIFVSWVTLGEWEAGLLNASGVRRQLEIRESGERAMELMTGIWHSSTAITTEYGRIADELRRAGRMIPIYDMWIAAAAIANDATLLSSDPHFRRISGLTLVDWSGE